MHACIYALVYGSAFAKGFTFKEFSALIGTEIRAVGLDVPKQDFDCLRAMKGFDAFDPAIEILILIEPLYGFKDVPRVWRKKLHQILEGWMSCQQLYVEPELDCVHSINEGHKTDAISRAQEHDAEQG